MKQTLILLLFSASLFAQTDWEKWDKAEVSYEIPTQIQSSAKSSNSNFGSMLLTGLQSSYSFLISDVDGDNCPFYPTCSSFYIHSIKETNFFQGTLMFADRFTRDSNILNRKGHYPRYYSGKFFDPTHNYYLIQEEVKYYSKEKNVE